MKKSISIGCHLGIIGILVFLFWPFVQRYLFSSAPSGNDYYVGLNYVNFFHKYFTWPPVSWENFWYSGEPAMMGYPWFHYYMMLPLTLFVGTTWALEIYSTATLFLFFLFSYFLFWELSKSKLFSLILAILLLNSRGVYNALPWNGFMAGSATQMFAPLTIYLILRFRRTQKRKILLLAGLMTGFAIMGHPLTGGFFVAVPAALVLLFWKDEQANFWSLKKMGDGLFLGLIAALTASPVLYSLGSYFLDSLSSGQCVSDACLGRPAEIIQSINPLFYVLVFILAILILILRMMRTRLNLRLSFVFLIPLLFLVSYFIGANLNLIGSITLTVWPERVTWVLALFSGAFLASLLGAFGEEKPRIALIPSAAVLLIMGVIWLGGWQFKAVFLDINSVFSSVGAYPGESYLYATDKYKETEIQDILPTWLRKDDKNYRMEGQNYLFNFWWPLATDIPATRGYVHFFNKNQSYWNGWLTAGLTNFWGESIARPESIVQNTALFLIDWNAIRYLEDSNRAQGVDNPYIDYLIKEPVSDLHKVVKAGQGGELSFFRIAEKETSPIVKASQAKTMLVVGLKETFVYDNINKVMAAENLNSRFLIPIRGPDKLDDLKKYLLSSFDLVFLNDYRYDDFQSWQVLVDYVKQGGKLIIETGTQVRESDSATLPEGQTKFPEVFPMTATKRDSLGNKWQLTVSNHPVLEGIDPSEFGALVYEGVPWKLSFVPSPADLRSGARVILSQAGQPFFVSRKLGQGEVIWSGMNLPYHFLYYDRPVEAKLFKNMVSYLLEGLPNGEVVSALERKRPEQVKISGNNFSGVVFKEHFNSGWQAKINGQEVKIYQAGPDFMYVRVPKGLNGEIKVEFSYRGTIAAWFFFLLSMGTIGYIICFLVFRREIGYIADKSPRFNLLGPLNKKISSWWFKGEEE